MPKNSKNSSNSRKNISGGGEKEEYETKKNLIKYIESLDSKFFVIEYVRPDSFDENKYNYFYTNFFFGESGNYNSDHNAWLLDNYINSPAFDNDSTIIDIHEEDKPKIDSKYYSLDDEKYKEFINKRNTIFLPKLKNILGIKKHFRPIRRKTQKNQKKQTTKEKKNPTSSSSLIQNTKHKTQNTTSK